MFATCKLKTKLAESEAFIKSKLCWLYRSIAQKYLWYYDELGKVSNTPCPVMLMYSVRGVVLNLHSRLLVTTIKQPGSHAMSFHKTWNNDRTHRSQNSATLGDIFCSKPSKTARTRSHLSKFIASDIIIVFSTYANSTNCSIDEAPYNGYRSDSSFHTCSVQTKSNASTGRYRSCWLLHSDVGAGCISRNHVKKGQRAWNIRA